MVTDSFLFGLPAMLICIAGFYYLIHNTFLLQTLFFKIIEALYIVILPTLFLLITNGPNDCCTESAFFSPEHRLSIYVIIGLCVLSYLYSSWRNTLAPPLIELIINCFLLIAILLNIVMIIQHNDEVGFILAVHIPIILLYITAIIKNQRMFLADNGLSGQSLKPGFKKVVWKTLHLNIWIKLPVLTILCLPLLVLLSACLLLFGQKPDSAIRAFTDTYKHGFSQLDYQCKNVVCPNGHFLCTIAAKGHKNLVRPIRLGHRAGNIIVCNRQLLISNAFEEILQQKLPYLHKPIRRFYNRIGTLIHRYYGIFNRPWISDSIYILMKPLEWGFLIVLYCCDKNPENRIARQYIGKNKSQ